MENKLHSMDIIKKLLLIVVMFANFISATPDSGTYVLVLNSAENFSMFKSNTGIRLVYFSKSLTNKEIDHQKKQFLMQYEKSAQLIKSYDVEFAKLACPMKGVADFCDRPKVENQVYVFRNGLELLALDLENMFDIDSIVSNVLQLVLLKDVPIVQKKEEKAMFVNMHKGKYDILFSYQHAIGTHAHRIFMEIAFAYQSKYKFALTTEKDVIMDMPFFNQDDESSIWLLRCTGVQMEDNECQEYKYWNNMDLMSLAKFIKIIGVPLVHNVLEDGEHNPFADLGVHTVTLFYDDSSYGIILRESSELKNNFFGLIGIVLVHVNEVKAGEYGYDYARMKTPTVTFQYKGETSYSIMPLQMSPTIFVNNHLSSLVKGFEKKNRDGVPMSKIYSDDSDIPDEDSEMEEHLTEQEVARRSEIELVETQDDHVAATMWKMRNVKIDRTNLPALNDKTFYKEVEDRDFLVVLFYVKFDPRGMAFLHHYAAASLELSKSGLHPLAAIDCFDWTDVCGKVNVTSYPTVNIYRKGQDTVKYKGMLSQKAMMSTVHLYLAKSPIQLNGESDYLKYVNGQIPENILKYTDISVIGLFQNKNEKEFTIFKELATEFEGKLLFAYFTGIDAKKNGDKHGFKPPSIVVHKRHDKIKPQAVFTGVFEHDQLSDFIFNQALAVFPELTVTNLPAYMSKKKPFVILFTDKSESDSQQVLSDIAKSEKFPDIIFCWMNATHPKSLASTILSVYSPAATLPAITLVIHERDSVHNYNGVDFLQSSITNWIENVMEDQIKPSRTLIHKEWKPRHPGYDFLKMIEEDKQMKKATKDYEEDGEIEHVQREHPMATTDIPDAVVREELQMLHKAGPTATQGERSTRFRSKQTMKEESQFSHTEL